jgi:hypothetical protein
VVTTYVEEVRIEISVRRLAAKSVDSHVSTDLNKSKRNLKTETVIGSLANSL